MLFLQESKAMIQRSFEVHGITTANPRLFRNDDVLKRIMALGWTVIELVIMMFKDKALFV